MEISIQELNELLQAEYERGRNSVVVGTYDWAIDTTVRDIPKYECISNTPTE